MPGCPRTLDVDRFVSLGILQEEGKADIFTEIARMFEAEARESLAEARQALGSENVTALRRVAHGLKGLCGTIGADHMRALAIQLEDVLATGALLHAGPVVHALTEECDQVTARLAPYTRGGPDEFRSASNRRDHELTSVSDE